MVAADLSLTDGEAVRQMGVGFRGAVTFAAQLGAFGTGRQDATGSMMNVEAPTPRP